MPVIDPSTRLGHVHYTTAVLDRQIQFYQRVLGFKVHWREADSAGLGAGAEDLLRFTHVPTARRVRGTTGLYHTAFLVPTRLDLAQLLKSIAETHTRIQGMTNHGTHYAIYLPDVEGNGIELAWDFPPEVWPRSFEEMMSRNRALPPQEVFEALGDDPPAWEGLNPATKVGHVHLHVADLEATNRFYHEILGFETPYLMESAIFYAAGGYHHHIGTNIWQGAGAPPPPPDAVGLRFYSVKLPHRDALDQVTARLESAGVPVQVREDGLLIADPAENHLLLSAGL